MSEEITLNTQQKDVNINCVLCFKRKETEASFDYKYFIEDGVIRFLPVDNRTVITNIYPLDGSTEAIEKKNRKVVIVELETTMLTDANDFDYFMEVDDFSNGATITPDSEQTSFLTVTVKDSLNLATEAHEETIEECVTEPLTEDVKDFTEEDRETVRTRFQQGDLTIGQAFGTPDPDYIRFEELDVCYPDRCYQYYYDPESDFMVFYVVKKEQQ